MVLDSTIALTSVKKTLASWCCHVDFDVSLIDLLRFVGNKFLEQSVLTEPQLLGQ